MKTPEKNETERKVIDKLREIGEIERRNDENIEKWRERNAEDEGADCRAEAYGSRS